MNIGIIGSGDVAKALAKGFLQHGHQVMLGTREPAKLADWSKENPHGQIGTFAAAAKFGGLVVLAVKGSVALAALRMAEASNLAGKTVIDTTNPIDDAAPSNGVLKFFTNLDDDSVSTSAEWPSQASALTAAIQELSARMTPR